MKTIIIPEKQIKNKPGTYYKKYSCSWCDTKFEIEGDYKEIYETCTPLCPYCGMYTSAHVGRLRKRRKIKDE